MVRLLTLHEFRTLPSVALRKDQVDALRRVTKTISISPTLGLDGYYDLTPGSTIGAIQLADLAIEIRPKIPIDRVLFLLSYLVDPKNWNSTGFDFSERDSLVEAIIPGFVRQVERAFYPDILQGYREEEDSLMTVRGRIRFDDQLRRRYGLVPPVECRFDEFTEDIEVNRLIKAALVRLKGLRIRSGSARRVLRAFDSLLETVQLVNYDPRALPEVSFNRLNARYKPAVEIAKLVLQWGSFELGHGKIRATTFLVDMNKVFETFVIIALREALRLSETAFPKGAWRKGLVLDEAERVRLQPDVSWWDGLACSFVGDVKYKKVQAEGILHPDLYQLLAYTVATQLPVGLLIYAAGEDEPAIHDVAHLGKKLEVRTLDLTGRPAEILTQIAVLAERIRELRREGLLSQRESAA